MARYLSKQEAKLSHNRLSIHLSCMWKFSQYLQFSSIVPSTITRCLRQGGVETMWFWGRLPVVPHPGIACDVASLTDVTSFPMSIASTTDKVKSI